MNTLWTFGDSFTAGHGCKPGDEYYEYIDNKDSKIWPEILATELQVTLRNKGIRGSSNSYILKELLNNVTKFKKNDIVIISDTSPIRTNTYSTHINNIAPLTTEELANKFTNCKDFAKFGFFKNDDEQKLYIDYVTTFILPYEKHWGEYYLGQILNIVGFLNTLNIQTYFWSHKVWTGEQPLYRRIIDDTSGKIKDNHWSFAGHQDFSSYLLERIKTKEYYYKAPLI